MESLRIPPKPMTDRTEAARRDAVTYAIPRHAYEAYKAQAASADRRDIPFLFTMLGWHLWWKTQLLSVPGAVRGRRRNEYVMARFGDQGPYEATNVYLATAAENSALIGPRLCGRKAKVGSMQGAHLKVRGDGHPKSMAVITPRGRFGSAKLAGEAFSITGQAAARKARERHPGWRYE
jgi:hypothetical protein